MKLSDIIPTTEQIKLVKGIESELLRNKRRGTIGGFAAIAGAVFQILIMAIERENYIDNIGKFVRNLIQFQISALVGPEGLSIYQAIGMLVLVIGFGTYFLFRRTRFLLKESEDPFRYTFWIKPFEPVSGTPGERFSLKNDDQIHLLHHDLMERLNHRIRRFSLLDLSSPDVPANAQEVLTSHIHISGQYAIRQEANGNWVFHVMPCIRIGPPGRPAALADPIKYPLSPDVQSASSHDSSESVLDADKYNQIVERIYSHIATKIYEQIFSDVNEKIALFPTNYLRAAALFHEAKDFERSNTIDSYDYAIKLYRKSKRYFDIRFSGRISRSLTKVRLLWRCAANSQLMEARTRIGYSRCLTYRRILSVLSGRRANPLFEIPGELGRAVSNLIRLHNRINGKRWRILILSRGKDDHRGPESLSEENQYRACKAFSTFPKDSPLKRDQPIFGRQRESLFDAYVVAALAYYRLGAVQRATSFLNSAKAVDPVLSESDPLWLLAAGQIEPELDKEILYFRRATEIAPDFEIAQYLLAYYSEMRLRSRSEINRERVVNVIKEYDEVLRINPGNIGALMAQGYLWWLLGESKEAQKKLEEGCETKATVRKTFIGDLSYGLARIAAERGEFNRSYDLYMQAISADPSVGVFSPSFIGSRNISSYYDYVVPDILSRYEKFRTNTERHIKRRKQSAGCSKYVDGEVTFSVSSEFKADLDSGGISNGLRQKLRDKNISLSGAANVSVQTPGSRWLISDNRKTYLISEEEDKLNIYGKQLSMKTLKAVHGFVLNDYGNSCLNYFHRFGDQKKLEEAIKAFQKSIEEWPENAVAYYDIYNAYSWYGEPRTPFSIDLHFQGDLDNGKIPGELRQKFASNKILLMESAKVSVEEPGRKWLISDELQNCRIERVTDDDKLIRCDFKKENYLEEAEKLAPAWPVVEIASLEAQIWRIRASIKEKTRTKEQLQTRIDKERGQPEEHRKQTIVPGKAKRQPGVQYAQVEVGDHEIEIEIRNLERGIEDLHKQIQSEVFPKIKTMMDQTRLGPLIRHLEIDYDGKGVDELCATTIDRGKMDENSIQAMEVWAGALSCNSEPKALEACDKLCHLIQRYYPEDFDANLILYEVYGDLKRVAEKEIAKKTIAAIIKNGLDQDPIRFVALKWAKDFTDVFPPDKQADFLRKAVESYEGAIKIDLGIGIYHAYMPKAYYELEEWNKAAEEYKKAIQIEPENDGYYNRLGNTYFFQGYYPEAIENYENAIEIDSGIGVYHANLANTYYELMEWNKAAEEYNKAIQIEENDDYYNRLGNTYFFQGYYPEAIENYENAIEIDRGIGVYHANMAQAYYFLGELEKAVNKYKEAIQIEENSDYYNGLGHAHFNQGYYPEALEDYERAIEIDPDIGVYHANLASTYYELIDWVKAAEEYSKAIQIEPENDDYYNRLGDIYFLQKNYLKAIENYKEATEINPGSKTYHSNLDKARHELQEQERGEDELNKG